MSKVIICHKCHYTLDFEKGDKVMRSEDCPKCLAAVRCCKMCKFYDPNNYNDCHEPQAPRVTEKDKSNFCDYFILYGPKDSPKVEDHLALAKSLFKD